MLQAWFSTSILLFASELPSAPASSPSVQVTSEGIPAMPESSVQALMQLTQEFEELANTCLLVLHLEVSYWTWYVAACLYKNCVHATLFGRPLGKAGDKHSCVLYCMLLNIKDVTVLTGSQNLSVDSCWYLDLTCMPGVAEGSETCFIVSLRGQFPLAWILVLF